MNEQKIWRLRKKVKVHKKRQQTKQQNENLSKQVTELRSTVIGWETRVKEAEMSNERTEAQTRRENLKFYSIDDDPKETWDQSEHKIRNYLCDQFEIDVTDFRIKRAHRLPSKSSPCPIIVNFSYFKDKENVFKVYRAKRKEWQHAACENFQEGKKNGNDADGSGDNCSMPAQWGFPQEGHKGMYKALSFPTGCYDKEHDAYLCYDTLVVDIQVPLK